MFSYHAASGPELSTTLCLEEFVKWQFQLDVSQTTTVLQFDRVYTRRSEVYYLQLRFSLGAINYPLIAWSGSSDPFNSGAQSFLNWESIGTSDLMCRLMMMSSLQGQV